MKLALILIFLIFSIQSHATSVVEFEWEELEGARLYQVEIRNSKNFLRQLESSSGTFKTDMTPGKYEIRGKVGKVNPQDRESDWSNWKSFNIPPPKIKMKQLPLTENKVSTKSYLSEVPLSWDEADGASEYLLDILDEQGNIVQTKTVQKTQTTLQLRPGYYKVRIRSKTADGLESENFELPEKIMVQKIPVEEPQKLKLENEKSQATFEPAMGTQVEVSLEMQKFLGKEWKLIDRKLLTTGSYAWDSSLPPGRYRLTLYSKNTYGEVSKPVVQEFIKKPRETDLPN